MRTCESFASTPSLYHLEKPKNTHTHTHTTRSISFPVSFFTPQKEEENGKWYLAGAAKGDSDPGLRHLSDQMLSNAKPVLSSLEKNEEPLTRIKGKSKPFYITLLRPLRDERERERLL